MSKKPNVLIIFTDQQRYDTINAAGYSHMITPNLDKLAEEGCLYTNAHTHNPVCMPARHDLLTGLTGKFHGYFSNAGNKCLQDHKIPTMPRIFSENGYRTASIGKMHFYPVRAGHGYNEMYTMEEIPKYRPDDDYAMYLKENGLGNVQNIHGVRPFGYHAAQKSLVDMAHYETTWLENTTKTWIDNNEDNPFMLFVSYIKPHPPWNIPEEYAGMYKDKELPPVIERSREYPNTNDDSEWYGDFDSDEMLRKNREAYMTACTIVDESIGKILEHLKNKNKLDETLIIFTSDHGEMMGDKGYYSKNLPYESSVRVPMIVRYPEKIKKNSKSETFVDLLDVMPTCLDICNLEYDNKGYNLYGKSILSDEFSKRDTIFASNGFLKDDRWVMSRNENYKYIYNYNCGFEEFYDLKNDIGEVKNIAKDRKDNAEFKELKGKAIAYEKEWGPDGGVVNDDFIVIESTLFPPHKHGKYHVWSNKQYQKFQNHEPNIQGENFAKELEVAFSNIEISGGGLTDISKNKEWTESLIDEFDAFSDGSDAIKKLLT